MISKKGYEALAKSLYQSGRECGYATEARNQWHKDVQAVVEVLEADNPRFEKWKFHLMCGYPLSTFAVREHRPTSDGNLRDDERNW
jgi:hypothetical protein